jgi:hypothetical protein
MMKSDDSQFYAIVGRALADPDFRSRLTEPSTQAEALKEAGVEPTGEVLEALANAVKSLDTLAQSFNPSRIAS